jgi:hypothetical protein
MREPEIDPDFEGEEAMTVIGRQVAVVRPDRGRAASGAGAVYRSRGVAILA